jgi:hypothetical protein
MLLRLMFLSACLASRVLCAQTPSEPATPNRPAILGSLERGIYNNPVIGFEIQLDPGCTFADESRAIPWSTQLPQRLSLGFRCGENLILFSSFPLHADEKINLKRNAQTSLQGAMAGGGFRKHGGWHNQTVDRTEMLVQELSRHDQSSQELGIYYSFMIGRRYVSILAVGPEKNRGELSQVLATLRVKPNIEP